MRLSVVTTSYNGARFLPACLESVFRQISSTSGVEIEHVVVDAASQDATLGILKAFAADRSQNKDRYDLRWISESDRGQSEGFNKGVCLAKSDWICWLNADDELAPGAVDAFLETLSKYPDADIIYGHVEFIDEDSMHLKTSYTLPYQHWLIRKNVWTPPSSGTFFCRELFLREPLDPNYHYVMDTEWFLRAGSGLQGVLVDRVMCRFRVSAEGKTSAMVTSGLVSERHALERERYRDKYIYQEWGHASADEARSRFERNRKAALLVYYIKKVRYIARYLRERFLGRTAG